MIAGKEKNKKKESLKVFIDSVKLSLKAYDVPHVLQ